MSTITRNEGSSIGADTRRDWPPICPDRASAFPRVGCTPSPRFVYVIICCVREQSKRVIPALAAAILGRSVTLEVPHSPDGRIVCGERSSASPMDTLALMRLERLGCAARWFHLTHHTALCQTQTSRPKQVLAPKSRQVGHRGVVPKHINASHAWIRRYRKSSPWNYPQCLWTCTSLL